MSSTSQERARLAIISSPRCGNTWLRRLLADMAHLDQIAVHAPEDVSWDALPSKVVLQLHWPPTPDLISNLERVGMRVVTMRRHPLDALISVVHYAAHADTSGWLQSSDGDETAIAGRLPCGPELLHYARSPRARALLGISYLWSARPDVTTVDYEELVADPAGVLAETIEQLGLPRCGNVDEVVSAHSFNRARANGNLHFWQGRPGIWRDLLPFPQARALLRALNAPVDLGPMPGDAGPSVQQCVDAWEALAVPKDRAAGPPASFLVGELDPEPVKQQRVAVPQGHQLLPTRKGRARMTFFVTDDWAMVPQHLPDGDAVVVVPVYDAYQEALQCYESLLRYTPAQVPILIVDDHGQDRRFIAAITDAAATCDLLRTVLLVRHNSNRGFVGAVNAAFGNTGSRDVVVVNSDVIVGAEWFERLRRAAFSDSVVATASPLTNRGSILSVPAHGDFPETMTVGEAADAVAAKSWRLYPRLPTAVGHCTYFRRHALDVVGFLDLAFAPGYSEEVDLSQRAIAAGFQHVCADDVFVYHRRGASFGDSPEKRQRQDNHHTIIRRRYPYYEAWVTSVEGDQRSPLSCSLLTATCALRGLSIGIDATTLHPTPMGTQRVALQSVVALSRRPEIASLTVLTPEHLPAYAHEQLKDIEKVHVLPATRAADSQFDVVYRPSQVNFANELAMLQVWGRRLVINQLDTIAYGNPSYFSDTNSWLSYRSVIRSACSAVDGLAFLTEYSRKQALSEGLWDPGVPSRIVAVALDGAAAPIPALEPSAAVRGHLRPDFLLCIGASYRHKNRVFALDVFTELKKRGWAGQLVLAGPTPPYGNSLADEALHSLQHALHKDVVALASVSEGEKEWLYQQAALVLYPTVVEGFGIVPFEAASRGAATLSTRQGALNEVLPLSIPTLDSWNAEDAADQVLRLLGDHAMRNALCAALLERARAYTSEQVATNLVDLFHEVVAKPRSRVAAAAGEGGKHVVPQGRPLGQVFASSTKAYLEQSGARPILAPPGSGRERLFRKAYRRAYRP